jgi:hypothetical protein
MPARDSLNSLAALAEAKMDIDTLEDADDEIECSYDVSISQALTDKLYQLQMPTLVHKSSSNIGKKKYMLF